MLQDNLTALRLATALLNEESSATATTTRAELQKSLTAFASMISKTEQVDIPVNSRP